jgi:hypothetical protein
MQQPIDVDLPHKLGRKEARRRIEGNFHKLRDRLNLTIHAMGQVAEAVIDVGEANVHCRIQLPGMLSLFAAPIEAMLKAKGGELLLEDKR